ncbi:MAG TPA: carbamoyl phosphate synthase small subunit, partial [Algoriphagus sp.]|nr:carbamoyl phosphate synthase small subunit [Algoriphagus sp.]
MIKHKATLLLADGTVFHGSLIGNPGTNGGEICFNTGMTGYQEIYTDPSYTGQVIVTTTSHIGNYGVHNEEVESDHPTIGGIVVNSFSEVYSRLDGHGSLQDYLVKYKITGIADIDTRKLVRHIRSQGAMNAIISSEFEGNLEGLKVELEKLPDMNGLELSSQVCTQEPYYYGDENASIKVACMDFGIKKNILRNLASRGVYCKVYPAKTKLAEMEEWQPNAYFLSNGPGDPAVMDYAVETVKDILNTGKPVFGICLGHKLLAESVGSSTYKMHYGHRGI